MNIRITPTENPELYGHEIQIDDRKKARLCHISINGKLEAGQRIDLAGSRYYRENTFRCSLAPAVQPVEETRGVKR